eukprot:TRINITY_DN41703_c0_g1_i1.p1 TRINITY_DN41703_c0_g1~~TRINITY_DN41703_c0_g1_i1.p1  ORF type:complete len:479 (+),score=119.28 TRINITY_DN41703_c0_g1_i1:151-1437(+)
MADRTIERAGKAPRCTKPCFSMVGFLCFLVAAALAPVAEGVRASQGLNGTPLTEKPIEGLRLHLQNLSEESRRQAAARQGLDCGSSSGGVAKPCTDSLEPAALLERAKEDASRAEVEGRTTLASLLRGRAASVQASLQRLRGGMGCFSKGIAVLLVIGLSVLAIKMVNDIKVDVGPDLEERIAEEVDGEEPKEETPGESSEPQHEGPLVIFLAVGRVKDKVVLACNTPLEDHTKADEAEKLLRKLLTKAQTGKMPAGERDFMTWEDGKIGWLLDPHGDYLACTATSCKNYPKSAAFGLLSEFMKVATASEEAKTAGKHKLSEAMKPQMQELLAKYENPAKSTVYGATLDKMDAIKGTMNQNIAQVQETANSMNALKQSTANMDAMARAFNKTTETAKWKYLLDRYKMYITGGIIVFDAIFLLVIVKCL